MAGAPAVTVTEGGVGWHGAAQTLKSVTIKNAEALFWVDEPFAVTMPLLARVTASVGVRITVTVAVAPTLIVPIAHVMLAGVPVGLVQDAPVEAVTELKQSLAADRDGSYHYQLYQLYKKVGDEKAAKAALNSTVKLGATKSAIYF